MNLRLLHFMTNMFCHSGFKTVVCSLHKRFGNCLSGAFGEADYSLRDNCRALATTRWFFGKAIRVNTELQSVMMRANYE